MRNPFKRFSSNASIVFTMLFALVGAGCTSQPLVPDATRGKTFAVYPVSIGLTVMKRPGMESFLGTLKDVSVMAVTAAVTAGYFVVVPKPDPGHKVAELNLGPPIMHEFASRFEREFGMRKVADITPRSSSKSAGGQLTKAEVITDYQNVADYLVQFDHASNSFVGAFRLFYEAFTDSYFIRYLVSVNVYDAKTGERLDWAGCNGEYGSAPLADWFKENGKMLSVGAQEIASKCADEMLRKLNKRNKS